MKINTGEFMGYYEYVATCLFGLEKFLADEIEALGYKKLETVDGRVTFGGDEDAVARFNIFFKICSKALHKTRKLLCIYLYRAF